MSGVLLLCQPSAAVPLVRALGDEVASSTVVWTDGPGLRGIVDDLESAGWDALVIAADDDSFSGAALTLRKQIHGVADVVVLHAGEDDAPEQIAQLGRTISLSLPPEVPVLLAGPKATALAEAWRPIAHELEIVQTAIATDELLVPMCSGAGKHDGKG